MIAATWHAAGHSVEVVTAVPDANPSPGPYQVTRSWTPRALGAAVARADLAVTNGYSRVAVAAASLCRRRLIVFHQGYQLICSDGLGFRNRHFHQFVPLEDLKLAFGEGIKPGLKALMRIPFDGVVKAWSRHIDHVVPSRHVGQRLGLAKFTTIYQPPNPLVMQALDDLEQPTAASRADAYAHGDVVFFGRLVFEKGCDDLIGAYAQWRAAYARALPAPARIPRLVIYGQGPEQAELTGVIQGLGLSAHVDIRPFLGGRNLAAAARAASVVVIPSRWEEPGATIAVELFACGAAVIASETGAMGEIFTGHGRLFPNGDVEGLALALKEHFAQGPVYPQAKGDEPWLPPAIQKALIQVLEKTPGTTAFGGDR